MDGQTHGGEPNAYTNTNTKAAYTNTDALWRPNRRLWCFRLILLQSASNGYAHASSAYTNTDALWRPNRRLWCFRFILLHAANGNTNADTTATRRM